jgi:hypothetical protein
MAKLRLEFGQFPSFANFSLNSSRQGCLVLIGDWRAGDMLQAHRSELRIDRFLEIKITNGKFSQTQDIELPSKIGRSPKFEENTSLLTLDSPYVSREHLLVEQDTSQYGRRRVIPCSVLSPWLHLFLRSSSPTWDLAMAPFSMASAFQTMLEWRHSWATESNWVLWKMRRRVPAELMRPSA